MKDLKKDTELNWAEKISGKASGIIILFLVFAYKDEGKIKGHTALNYHLHILQFKDSYGNIGYICLDTSAVISMHSDDHDQKKAMTFLAESFVGKLDSMVKADVRDRDLLFEKVPAVLWEKFNMIKEESFLSSIPGFLNYAGSKNLKLAENIQSLNRDNTESDFELDSESLGKAKISIVEERRLLQKV
jgi:hypothetical protein